MNIEDLEIYLPKYLSDEKQRELYSDLKDFPNNINKIFGSKYLATEDLLQSDIVENIPYFNLPSTESKLTKVIIISNSCDIDPQNKRDLPPKVSYAPLISLSKFINLLKSKKIDETRIEKIVNSIKKQEKTNIFFVPQSTNLNEDYIVFFENMLSIDRDYFFENHKKNATFSNYGFYMFLLKLSLHFTRIQEKVDRG